jgi:hypothetical protein
LSVAPNGLPVGSNVKVPVTVSVPVPPPVSGTVLITDGDKLYVMGTAVAGDGTVRNAGAASAIAGIDSLRILMLLGYANAVLRG